jgi:hypothetical protein
MKKLISFLSILMLLQFASFGQVTVSTVTLTGEDLPVIGETFDVPITVLNMPPSIFSLLIYIDYDPTVMNYESFTNNQIALPDYPFLSTTVASMSTTRLRIQVINFDFLNPFGPFTLPDGDLVDLHFNFQGGDSPISFVDDPPQNCTYNDGTVTPIPNLIDGAILGGFIDNTIGDGAWETSGDWSLGVVPNAYHNVLVQGMATVDSDAACNDLSIEVDGELTVNMGASLDVAGDILIDGDETGTASFVNKGTFTMAGEATVKQYLTGGYGSTPPYGNWHLISVPVDAVESYDVFLNCYLQTWDEPNSTWVDVQTDTTQAGSQTLNTPMMGYSTAFHGSADKMLEFTGTLNDGAYSIAVTDDGLSGDADLDGWNLIGNPYPSALDVDGVWTRVNVSNGVAYWDETFDNYRYYADGVPVNDGSRYIPPMQGFFVKASGTGTIGVTNETRAHTTQGFYKSDPANTLRLMVQHGDFTDETAIRFVEDASIAYDEQFDFFKLIASDVVPQIYSINSDNESMAINALPVIDENVPVNVGLKPGVNGMMSLTASGLETFDSNIPVWLYDQVADLNWNLRDNPVYNFVANTQDDVNRFSIHFKSLTSVAELDQAVANIFAYNKQVYVDAGNAKGEIVVLNVLGQELVREQLTEQMNVISLPVSNSYVVVKVISDQGISSKKVFVN